MATEVPQRALRNETAALLRRVEAGERLTIHPVAELGPASSQRAFVPSEELVEQLSGTLSPDDDLAADLRAADDIAIDPFE